MSVLVVQVMFKLHVLFHFFKTFFVFFIFFTFLQYLAQIILNTFHPLIHMFQLMGCASGSVELLGNKLIHMWQLLGCPSGSVELLGNKYVPAVVFKLTSKLPTNYLTGQCFNRITRESKKIIKFTNHLDIPSFL